MNVFSEEYYVFRTTLINCNISEIDLHLLISLFHSEINSKRRTSYISTLEDLIGILEKRGFIGEDKIENFANCIAALVPTINIIEMMARYQQVRSGRHPQTGQFSRHNRRPSSPVFAQQHSSTSERSEDSNIEFVTRLYCVLPVSVMERIERDIGSDWKKFARELQVREGDIDEIEYKKTRYEERAHKCLKSFLKNTDPHMVPSKLLSALERCGRQDIKKAVEQRLTTMNPY
ncbi:hypothetical protein C0J52_00846 [Blattella germanica]|nr:hypothetical protein C0J52_00846 [Blattella germanica]